MKFNTSKKQSGVAAIIFLLMFPALFGIFVWGVEGARAVQDSARLVDAVEVAALTVASQDVDNEAECRAIAKSVVAAYFPESIEVSVPAKTLSTPCISSVANRFDITASVEQETWFPKAMASFGESYLVSNSMSATRDRLGAMDVVIAADYSFSMADYEMDMKSTVAQIANYIDNLNENKLPSMPDSRLAIVGFDQFVYYTDSEGNKYYTPHLVCTSVVGNSSNEYNCNKENNTLLENSAKDGVYDHWNIGSYNTETKGKISVDYTLDHIFDPLSYKDDSSDNSDPNSTNNTNGNGGETGNIIDFYSEAVYDTVDFSDDPLSVNLDDFSMPPGENPDFGPSSASYTGLIQAALLMNNFGENRIRKIIILTNGDKVDPFAEVAEQLINAGSSPGLCNTVVNAISALKGPNNLDVKFELFVINYDGSSPDLDVNGFSTGGAIGDTQIEMCAEASLLPNIADNLYEDVPPGVVDYTSSGATNKIDLIMGSMMAYMGRLLEDE